MEVWKDNEFAASVRHCTVGSATVELLTPDDVATCRKLINVVRVEAFGFLTPSESRMTVNLARPS